MILTANDISYTRDDKSILNNINFTVQSTESLMITGRNGAGKTTLLKIIAGLFLNHSGTITFDGQDIHDHSHQYKKSIAYLGHKNALYDNLTVEQNLSFWAELRNTLELMIPTIYFFNLHSVIDIKCSKLSAGWRRRVAIARLLLSDAEIWLLDEPCVNLDKEFQEQLYNLLKTRTEQKGILILTSHSDITMENMQYLNLDQT